MGRWVIDEDRKGLTRVSNGPSGWLPHILSDLEEETFEPLIITPVVNKDYSQKPFPEIWQRAKQELSECNRLILGGYSFPHTDFATRRLFLEAFADNTLDELVVINPDTSLVETAKDYCHFQKPVLVCRDFREFINSEAPSN
jgi:hypothetical protein